MNKLSISIDLLKLVGAQRMTSKSGKDILVIDIAASRTKPHANGKLYLNLEAIERKDGADDYGNTHFVCEPVTKQERENVVKLPIIGNGKTWDNKPQVHHANAQRVAQRHNSRCDDPSPTSWKDDKETDDIPF